MKGHDKAAYTEFAVVVTPRLFRTALLLCGDCSWPKTWCRRR